MSSNPLDSYYEYDYGQSSLLSPHRPSATVHSHTGARSAPATPTPTRAAPKEESSSLCRLTLRVVPAILLAIGIALTLIGGFVSVNKITTVYSASAAASDDGSLAMKADMTVVYRRDAYFTSAFNNVSSSLQNCSVKVAAGPYVQEYGDLDASYCADMPTPHTIKNGVAGAALLITGLAMAFLGFCLTHVHLIIASRPSCHAIATVVHIVRFVVVVLCVVLHLAGVIVMCVGSHMSSASSTSLFVESSNATDWSNGTSTYTLPREKDTLQLGAGPALVIVSLLFFAAAAVLSVPVVCA